MAWRRTVDKKRSASLITCDTHRKLERETRTSDLDIVTRLDATRVRSHAVPRYIVSLLFHMYPGGVGNRTAWGRWF